MLLLEHTRNSCLPEEKLADGEKKQMKQAAERA